MPSKKKLQKALEKDREIQELQRKLEEDKHWNEGIDERGKKREEKQNKQQEEKMRKAKEMRELIARDEEIIDYSKNRPKSRRGKRELNSLEKQLEDRPITKAERILREKEREKDADKFKQLLQEEKEREEEEKREKEYRKKNIVSNQNLFISVDNRSVFEENSVYQASTIEDAVNIFNDDLPNENTLYKDFYQRNLPIVKNELPGLRLSQYKDKIRKMWKISYENPKNNH